MGSEPTVTWTEPNTEVTGKKISSMATGWRRGPMVPAMKETMWKDASMGKGASRGVIRALTRVNSSRTTLKATVSVRQGKVETLLSIFMLL